MKAILVVAALLRAAALTAAVPDAARTVLLVVPEGADLATVGAVRAAIDPAQRAVLVGAAADIPLRGGLTLRSDATPESAPEAATVVVLSGHPSAPLAAFVERRAASATLLLLETGAAGPLRSGAVQARGGRDEIASALRDATRAAAPGPPILPSPPVPTPPIPAPTFPVPSPTFAPPTPNMPPVLPTLPPAAPTPSPTVTAPPPGAPTPPAAADAFDRYFSSSSSATARGRATPTPAPRP